MILILLGLKTVGSRKNKECLAEIQVGEITILKNIQNCAD